MRPGFDPAEAAKVLHDVRQAQGSATALRELHPALAPRDEADGVAVQHALAKAMGATPPGGFKIGATTARMQQYLGVPGPIGGFMPARGLHASAAVLPWDQFRNVGVECEIGVRLAADLPAGPCDPAAASAAVGELFAAIEIVENRYGTAKAGEPAWAGIPVLIADQMYHAAAVLGAPAPGWRSLDLAALPGRIAIDGAVVGEGVGAELLGHPMAALAWLAGSAVAAAFGGLRAGQVVMLGSVTPPIWLDRPCGVSVAFAGLEPVTLRLTGPEL